MTDEAARPQILGEKRRSLLSRLWRRIRTPLAQSSFVKSALVSLLAAALRFIKWTNPEVPGSHSFVGGTGPNKPVIAALWHGQHLLGPCFRDGPEPISAMFSRSADAEINARVFEKMGNRTVRGSGGRDEVQRADRGGARALIEMKRELDGKTNVIMIADIPHGTPREAGLGIIMLAKISQRPIMPLAIATSRRKVLEKSWDKTTIPLPFGRSALQLGPPIWVPRDADDAVMEEKRLELTRSLNETTARVHALVDGAS